MFNFSGGGRDLATMIGMGGSSGGGGGTSATVTTGASSGSSKIPTATATSNTQQSQQSLLSINAGQTTNNMSSTARLNKISGGGGGGGSMGKPAPFVPLSYDMKPNSYSQGKKHFIFICFYRKIIDNIHLKFQAVVFMVWDRQI